MHNINLIETFLRRRMLYLSGVILIGMNSACHKSNDHNNNNNDLQGFQQVNLVANQALYGAKLTDTTLKDAWGLAFSSSGVAWVNSLSGHVSELYTAEGGRVRSAINIPSPADTIGGNPTGIVLSDGKGFKLPNGQGSLFLFVGVDGILSGWNAAAGNRALVIRNNSATAVYTGLAIASSGGANYIYAADFKTAKIDVWDTTFAPVSMPFRDPGLPAGYAPFNIQAVGSSLFVMYAKVGPDGEDAKGVGNGFVDIFGTDGSFIKRFASQGTLNAPWGVAQAPAGLLHSSDMNNNSKKAGTVNKTGNGFGQAYGDISSQPAILVGNFGDGRINVFTLAGQYLGQLQSANKTIVIDGLWALSFPPSSAPAIDPNRLYFTAGPADEKDGLFGYLSK
jgi:uncharacterized protein (TIGR03118 family)